MEWIKTSDKLPPENVVVNTKISDRYGDRNKQPLTRKGKLWFFPEGTMYVYYTPTHWKEAI